LVIEERMRTRKSKSRYAHPFAYDGLERVIHERARLGLLTSLIAHPAGLSFGDLKQLCALTDGNLSRHLQVLEEAKLVEVRKGYEGARPLSMCRITNYGRRRYLDYLAVLEQVITDSATVVRLDPDSAKS
jgi:DNA-binding transcriptional ArsR family regulator